MEKVIVFSVENANQFKLTVQLEPWAELFYLRKGDVLTIHQPESLKGYYHTNLWGEEKMSQIIGCGDFDYDYPTVHINGKLAEPWNDFSE